MTTVRLKRNWPAAEFRRCLRDEQGEIVRTLTFPRGETVDLDEEEYRAVMSDIGPALEDVETLRLDVETIRNEAAKPGRKAKKQSRVVREDNTAQDAPPAAE